MRCNKYRRLCERFGILGAAGAPGVPHVLWFQAGRLVGPYDGKLTVAGFTQWVLLQQEKELAKTER